MSDINVFSQALKSFAQKDAREMAKNSGGEFDGSKLIIPYMGNTVEISYPDGDICWKLPLPLVKNDHVLILQYLSSACGVRPRGSWIPFIQLPNGTHHQHPFVIEALNPLAETFGEDLDRFSDRVKKFGGETISMADFGAVIPVFPFLPLAVCMWEGDDEFPAKANILFDITSPLLMTTASLWVLGVELSRKLRGIVGQQFMNTKI